MDRFEMQHLELEVLKELRRVRLVFELGFPDDLVAKAGDVVREAIRGDTLFRGSGSTNITRVAYPACFLLHVADLAKDRSGDSLWTSDELSHLLSEGGAGSATRLAGDVTNSIRALGLDTFESLIETQGALRNITPITMHSGLPIKNLGALLRLIDSAIKRGRYTAEEQIKYWSSSLNGFHGLWIAPKRLFQDSGSIGQELLEQINDHLGHLDDPGSSGLPAYLIEAIDAELAASPDVRGRKRIHLPRPRLLLDPFSQRGPILKLPVSPGTDITRWRTTGTVKTEYAASLFDVREVDLVVKESYEVSAIGPDGTSLESRSFRAFRNVPVYFFDPQSGRLLECDRSRVDVNVRTVLALIHPRAEIVGGTLTHREFPPPIGAWSGWTIAEFDISVAPRLTLKDSVNADVHDEIFFRRGLVRPTLSPPTNDSRRLRYNDLPVYNSPPTLNIDIGSVDPGLVSVIVTKDDRVRVHSFDSLAKVSDGADLGSCLSEDGVFSVEIKGPSGLSMRQQSFLLLRGLRATQSPPLALPGDQILISLAGTADSKPVVAVCSDRDKAVSLSFSCFDLTVLLDRLTWSYRLDGEDVSPSSSNPFRVTADELSREGSIFLYLDSGLPQSFSLALELDKQLLHTTSSPTETSRWAMNLGLFLDDVRNAGAESLDVIATVSDGRRLVIGAIVATYVVDAVAEEVDASIAPAVIRLTLVENKTFRSRVARIWNLDRPWEESFPVSIPDDRVGAVEIVMPIGHKRGNFRIWVRVEGPLSMPPKLPTRGTRGTSDVLIRSGSILDTNDPVDRLISAVNAPSFGLLRLDDVVSHGYVLIALLAQEIRDGGGAALSSIRVGTIYKLLQTTPDAIIQNVARAITRDVLTADDRLPVSLALLPVIFESEDAHDLAVDAEVADLVWSDLPWLGATVEPWDDSDEAQFRWSNRLGWPSMTTTEEASDGENSLYQHAPAPIPPTRTILDESFQRNARLAKERPDLLQILEGDFVGTRTDLPLSRDAEGLAVVTSLRALTDRETDVQIRDWRLRHVNVLQVALANLQKHPCVKVLSQYEIQAMSQSTSKDDKWFFHNTLALAVELTSNRARGEVAAIALIDGAGLSPQWVGYALLLALSVQPYSRLESQA